MRTKHARQIRKGIELGKEAVDAYEEQKAKNEKLYAAPEVYMAIWCNIELRKISMRINSRKARDHGKLTYKAYWHIAGKWSG